MRLRWLIGALMFVGGMINYLDRSAMVVTRIVPTANSTMR